MQLTLTDAIEQGHQGQTIAANNAGGEWAGHADRLIAQFLTEHAELHTDTFWDWAEQRGLENRGRAIGARYKAAARAGLMAKTDRVRPSARSNGTGKPVWVSLTYGQAAA